MELKMEERFIWYFCIFGSLIVKHVYGQTTCSQGYNCKLPDCFCATKRHPLPVNEIPQIIYFAFDDEIDETIGSHYERLFHPSRKNPNGCPITMTMLATNHSTSYGVMDKFYSMGMEIGSHNTKHMTDKNVILNETRLQKEYISKKTNIPTKSITGYRSPYLATAGDEQVEALLQNGYKYDISYTYTRRPESGLNAMPFTLDFGWTYPCNINPCPKQSHKGFWEVPINSMWDYTKTDICAYADSCTYSPPSANEIFKYLWNNFNNSYSKNKAPFGIHMHGRWLNDGLRLWAVDKFIREVSKLPDVYIVSVDRMLKWMQNPVKLSEIQNFSPWKCKQNMPVLRPLPTLPERCEQGVNCHLPACFCDHLNHEMSKTDIPQMVYFAFDGPIDGTTIRYLQTLFYSSRKNPNGCPIRFTTYVSHEGTDYNEVQDLYNNGAEIGSNGLGSNYLATKESVLAEAFKMKQNIVSNTKIPISDIKGFRSPYLSTAGDGQVEALKQAGYNYDISYTFTRRPSNSLDAWPVTLDYGWPYICNIEPCPENSHKGFWEVPVNSLYDWTQTDFCTYADECRNQPKSEEQTYQYLMDNFMNGYRTNKVPFGIHLHSRWFHIHRNLRGVNRFIEDILKKKDVYIVSVNDVIEWVKNPTPLNKMDTFPKWTCEGRNTNVVQQQPALPPPSSECQNGVNCHLPYCFCATLDHPLPKPDIPQIVYFAFDDNVNLKYAGYYFNLFDPKAKNPNNCPMTFTLFTSNKGTDYSFVEYFHRHGSEIASHGTSNSPTNSKRLVLMEAGSQKQNIIDKTNVTAKDVIGFRSPQLSTAGDDQVDILRKLGYKYDASYTFTRRPETGKNAWPFTGDYGWPYDCNIPPCPYHSHKGFWFIPVNSMWDYTKENICTFTDECKNQPPSENDVFNYLWNNFINSYKGNRAPFGIHMQPQWLNDMKHLTGVRRFIEMLSNLNDVYVVSISKMLEWMKNPRRLKDIGTFGPWTCTDASVPRPKTSLANKIVQEPSVSLPPKQVKQKTHASFSFANQVQTSTGNQMGVPIVMSFSNSKTIKETDRPRPIKSLGDVLNLPHSEVTLLSTLPEVSIPSIFQPSTKPPTTSFDNSLLNVGECLQGQSCLQPFCYCQGKTIPMNLPKMATPQMVFLDFDGTLNHADHGPYLDLLANRKNPNNCSISATFFVNQVGSNITAIKDMHDRGYEIAMRGNHVLRPSNISELESEISTQMKELNRHGITDISGWKTVGYTSLTNEFKNIIEKYGFQYDSTNYYDNQNNLWPYTVDFGPTNKSLLWEIPNLALTDYMNVYQCQYADGCFNSPTSANSTFAFLWSNFKKHYVSGNKAPFGISFRKTWLSHPFYGKNIDGLKLFLDVILNLSDVYVVSARQVMNWMQSPLPLADIPRSQLWTCK